MEPATSLRVEIWSDLVCPWCYLGRARFMAALETFEHRDAVTVAHRSFELDPTTPRGETTTLMEHLSSRFGSEERVLAGEQRLIEATGEVGLGYRVDRLHGNTFDAHRLIQLGVERDLGEETLTSLYRANFAEGRSIFDLESLVGIAGEVGLDAGDARAVLESDMYADRVREDEGLAGQLGIQGVPFFVLDRLYGISGAQPIETLTRVLEHAWAEGHADEASPA
jgi:predicted DsbA family dithiol-disulfide isomerase